MALSIIEKRVVQSIIKDTKENQYKRPKYLLLTLEGVKTLIEEGCFNLYRLKYLNNDTIYNLLVDINNNSDFYSDINLNIIYQHALSERSNSFISTLLKSFPDFTTHCILRDFDRDGNKFIMAATNEEIITILNSYRENKIEYSSLLGVMDDITLLISRLKDEDKIQFIDLIPHDNSYLETIITSIKDHEIIQNFIYNYICSREFYLPDDIPFTKYITHEELLTISLKYVLNNTKFIPDYFNSFTISERLQLLDTMPSIGDRYLFEFIKQIISDSLDQEQNLFIYDQINDIFTKHEVSNFNNLYGFEDKINNIVSTMSSSELLKVIKEIKHSSLHETIINNDSVWTNHEIFTYLLETNIKFIFDKVKKTNDFRKYPNEVKELFSSKKATMAFAKYNGIELLSIKQSLTSQEDEYYTKMFSYFNDDSFCYELLKQSPQSLTLCLRLNPQHEFLTFAKEQGYYPDLSTYNFVKENPEYKDEWFAILKALDPRTSNFIQIFSSLIYSNDEEVMDIIFHKAAININTTYSDFVSKFNALKKVNCEVLKTFDYRLFGEKFNFLTMDKIEFIGAHHKTSKTLCDLNDSEIEAIKRVISYSSNINWIDLLDRVLLNIGDYTNLIADLKGRDLSVYDIGLLTKALVQKNILNLQSYQDLQHYNQLIGNRITSLSKSDNIDQLKEAISLSVLGLDYNEFVRISAVYCFDLDNLKKYSKNKDLIKALTFIRQVASCQDINILKEILANTPRMNLSNEFIVNFDSEIRREFASLYNDTLYHVSEEDKTATLYFKEVKVDGDKTVVVEVPKGEGEAVSFYSPIGLDPNNQREFAIMMTSLGAYSIANAQEPDDYYSNWNVDMISSHGFCCSYLTNDNLGTARICHAVLGFTDFSLDSLLLSAPYDIGSNSANQKFNTSRATNTRYCTPRGMVDNTRHTHNEVVWERRNLGVGGSFKKEPSYVIFFCEDMASLKAEEKNIYQSTIKAAVQLGHGKPLPIIVIERSKIAKYQQQEIISDLRNLKDNYEPGLIKKIITRSISNIVGNTYVPNINNLYFNDSFQDFVTLQIQNYITSLMKNGNYETALKAINELNATMQHEMQDIVSREISSISLKLNNLSTYLQIILKIFENNKDFSSPTVSNLLSLVMNINDNSYTQRWNEYLSNHSVADIPESSTIHSYIIKAIQNNTLIDKIIELEQDNIYKDNTPYNNRHYANMFFYASLFYTNSQNYLYEIKLEEILDAIKFSQCSYMDGNDKKNTDSALAKAETIMDSKGYNDEQKERIKLLIILQNERNITPERLDEILKYHRIAKNPFISIKAVENAINIMHDAMCLEHARFITNGEIESSYFYDQSFYKYTKLAYQLQEGYAMIDLNEYIKDHPEVRADILLAEKTQNPQTIIRNLRKKRFVPPKHSNNTFEDAFLSIDVPEKTDPLNLVSTKMQKYGDLPPQISLLDFYKLVSKMPLYAYLKEQIAVSPDLYLKTSAIHGATHANNVALFATFIASSIGLSAHDTKTLIESSIYHDIGRVDDTNSRNHGRLGAIKYSTKVTSPSDINKEEVQFLIEAHAARTFADVKKLLASYHFMESDHERLLKMAAVIRDADALDRTRFRLDQETNNLNPNYLFYDISKKMIEACQRLNYIIYEDYIKAKTASDNITLS